MSFGVRVVTINSVLASIPLYYMSFFKILKKVLSTLVGIQRAFLWSCYDYRQKISLVSWDQIC